MKKRKPVANTTTQHLLNNNTNFKENQKPEKIEEKNILNVKENNLNSHQNKVHGNQITQSHSFVYNKKQSFTEKQDEKFDETTFEAKQTFFEKRDENLISHDTVAWESESSFIPKHDSKTTSTIISESFSVADKGVSSEEDKLIAPSSSLNNIAPYENDRAKAVIQFQNQRSQTNLSKMATSEVSDHDRFQSTSQTLADFQKKSGKCEENLQMNLPPSSPPLICFEEALQQNFSHNDSSTISKDNCEIDPKKPLTTDSSFGLDVIIEIPSEEEKQLPANKEKVVEETWY